MSGKHGRPHERQQGRLPGLRQGRQRRADVDVATPDEAPAEQSSASAEPASAQVSTARRAHHATPAAAGDAANAHVAARPLARDSGSRTATIERPPASADLSVETTVAEPSAVEPSAVEAGQAEPTSLALIVPGGGTGSRRAARQERRGRRRKQALIAGALAVLVALVVWAVYPDSPKPVSGPTTSAEAGVRTQTTMLLQVKASNGNAVASALVAHDPAHGAGVVVLVPGDVIGQVPGFGRMPFGQALALGQPTAPQATLSDLIGVTIDGSWVLTQPALQALVDKVGGVSVDVDVDVTAPGPNGTTKIIAAAGRQQLDGAAASAFASFLAAGEVEQARLARFDAVFDAVLAKLPKQSAAVGRLLTSLGAGSTSSMPTSRVADMLVGLAADDADDSTTSTILPVTKLDVGGSAYTLDIKGAAAMVTQNFAQSVPANKKATGNRVMIENQVGTPGVGETTRAKLLAAGFTYVAGQNAPGMPNATAPSVVLIQGSTAADIVKGNQVAQALGLPTADVRISSQPTHLADVVVLLGADYTP